MNQSVNFPWNSDLARSAGMNLSCRNSCFAESNAVFNSQAPYKVNCGRTFTVKIFGNGLLRRPGGLRGPISDFPQPQAPYSFRFLDPTMSCGHSARISLVFFQRQCASSYQKKTYDPESSPQFWDSERRTGLEKNRRYPS